MSINTLSLLSGQVPFALGVGEKLQFSTPTGRQPLVLKGEAIHISTTDGRVFLTNHRLVYVTGTQGDIELFAVDLSQALALRLSHAVKTPWFGANYWEFLFLASRSCDGLPAGQWITGTIRFNNGGLFDFVGAFNSVLNDALYNKDVDEELPAYAA